MLNKNSTLPDTARLKAILEDPDAILQIESPTEKMQLAAVQKKPELVRLFTNTTEKVQLSAVTTSAESIFLIHNPSPTACFVAMEGILGLSLFPGQTVLKAAKELVLQMQKDKAGERLSTAAIEKFMKEVEPFKN